MNYGMNPYYGAGAMYSNDPYLAHHGVKNMKWYQHIFGPLQSASKYALGENTLGYHKAAKTSAKTAEKWESEAERLRANARSVGNNKIYANKIAEANKKAQYYKQQSESFRNASRASFKTGAIYRGASAIAGMAVGAAKKIYGAASTVGSFIKTAGGRALTGISNLAGRFKRAIKRALPGSDARQANARGRSMTTHYAPQAGTVAAQQDKQRRKNAQTNQRNAAAGRLAY